MSAFTKSNRFLPVLIITCFLFLSSLSPQKPSSSGITKIVIDAGHGGKDPGCRGASVREKDVALSIALKLGEQIKEHFRNIEVVYTRKSDIFLELHERAKIANETKADLFICIHANSGPTSIQGVETYVMGLHVSEANLDVAKRENSSILMEDNYNARYAGFDPNSDESYIAISLMQSAFLEQSLNFASRIQKKISLHNRADRGVKQAGFLVLYKTSMPAVLIETGFLTHKEEEIFLGDTANQLKISRAIFDAFKEYKTDVEGNINAESRNKKQQHEPERTEQVRQIKSEEKVVIPKDSTLSDSLKQIPPQEKIVKAPKNNPVVAETRNGPIDNKIIFRVQVATSPVKLKPEKFKELGEMVEYKEGELYKYAVGRESLFDTAVKFQSDVRTKGYKDAFVVAFHNGKRIPVNEAVEMLKHK